MMSCVSLCSVSGFLVSPSSVSPDSHSGLDQGGDSHSGENGSDQLTDGVLVSTHTHGFGQEEWYCYSAAETRQVVL